MRNAQVVNLSGSHRWSPTFCALLGVCFLLTGASAHGTAPPNIVVILSDDQSWNGTSVQMDPNIPNSKSDFYQTPRLEQLAAQGMRFSNGYSSSPVCATTRAALQTGRSPAQLQMADMPHALPPGSIRWEGSYEGLPLMPPMPEVFSSNNYTIPRAVKDANASYVTAHYGKWHLDYPVPTSPQAVGYDFGFDPPLPANEVDPWGVFNLANLANNFMQDRVAADQPFFLQISHKAVHPPVRSREAIRDKYEALPPGSVHSDPAYAAMTEDLDTSVGLVMDKISQLGIEDNTYVFFVADNGAPLNLSSSFPLRYGKATIQEGGIRVPYIVKGPGVEAGTYSSVPVTTTDLFSTIAELAGRDEPLPSNVEGASLVPLMHNGGELPTGMSHLERNFHTGGEIYWHWPVNFGAGPNYRTRPSSAVRDGDYKLFVQYGEHGSPDEYYLYNLATNIGENVNLATSMPQKTAELKSKLDNYLAAVDAPFAYDVKRPTHLNWDAGAPGSDAAGWRSTIDVQFKGRETWTLGGGIEQPALVSAGGFQPGLSGQAFSFDGSDLMRRKYFHVGDVGPRKNSTNVGTPDFDRSATVDLWFRADALNHNQVLFESGDGVQGLSITLGDADGNGSSNDLRFRVLGGVKDANGKLISGPSLTATVAIDAFADPTTNFIHATAVFNDSEANRFVEVYINGALAGRVSGAGGPDGSLFWDGYDEAGLGKKAGSGLGANGGTGALPFDGGFTGKIAAANFWNHALTPSQVAGNYNSFLDPVNLGVLSRTGEAVVPTARPTSVALSAAESNSLLVVEERRGVTSAALSVDNVVTGATIIGGPDGLIQQLASGTGFTSYLLHFDPLGNNPSLMETVTGSVTFAENIIGLLFDDALLQASDKALGSIGNYGASIGREIAWASGDFLSIGADQRTLSFNLSSAGDELVQFRVLTSLTSLAPADFNNDGMVDGADLTAWRTAFGSTPGADADGDGDTDGNDFLRWQQNVGLNASSPAAASVPEPAALALVAVLAFAGAAAPRTRRR